MMRLLILCLLLTSCGPSWYLRKAKEKGAEQKIDTVFQTVTVPKTVHDTVTRFQTVNRLLAGDTIRINTTKWKLKQVIDTIHHTNYVQVECPETKVTVPAIIKNEIKAGFTGWQLAGMVLVGIAVGWLIGQFVKF